MISTILLVACLWVQDPYILVLKNDKRIEVREEPQCSGQRCVVILMNGERTSLPSSLIDQSKTNQLNKALAEERERQAAKLRAEEEKAAKQAAKEKEKEKTIEIKSTSRLPSYDRTLNQTTGSVNDGDDDPEAIGGPVVYNYNSGDPVFLKTETRQRYQGYYEIACKVAINAPAGARNITIEMKVNFSNSPPTSFEKDIPGEFGLRDETTVVFRVPSEDEILQTSFTISAETI